VVAPRRPGRCRSGIELAAGDSAVTAIGQEKRPPGLMKPEAIHRLIERGMPVRPNVKSRK